MPLHSEALEWRIGCTVGLAVILFMIALPILFGFQGCFIDLMILCTLGAWSECPQQP